MYIMRKIRSRYYHLYRLIKRAYRGPDMVFKCGLGRDVDIWGVYIGVFISFPLTVFWNR